MNRLLQKFDRWINGSEIVFFHEFHKPPFGGGNQFLIALKKQLEMRGLDTGTNRVGPNTRVCLFNSHCFNFNALRNAADRFNPRFIHRVDGPIGAYRGEDDGTDRKIWQINHEIADVTVFQSEYSLRKHKEMKLEFKNPVIIHNAVDPEIFNPKGRIGTPDGKRKIRIIASSWSNNPRKGGPVYKWIEDHLDWDRYEFTFIGRTRQNFTKIKTIDARPSEELADILRQHDVFITASQEDPCSNALLEALSCGLPVVYLNSGGHPELVKDAGEPFASNEESLIALDKVAKDYGRYQSKIQVDSIERVAERYYELMRNTD